MKILSLFDGISCGAVALERAGIDFSGYHACEVDKYATQISTRNWPQIIRHGSVVGYQPNQHFDYLIGGSPCQGFSFSGKGLAFDDPRSALFFEYVRILKECQIINPGIKFLLENVRMKKEHLAIITEQLGVEPICINSALLSAQNRVRYYWCNWAIEQPEDKGLLLKDILEEGAVDREKSYCIDANYHKGGNEKQYFEKAPRQLVQRDKAYCLKADYGEKVGAPSPSAIKRYETKGINQLIAYSPRCQAQILKNAKSENEKAVAVCTNSNMTGSGVNILKQKSNTLRVGGAGSPPESKQCWDNALDSKISYRKLTVIECERLQTLPDNYTAGVSNTQRYKALGNGWTVDVIAHILKASLKK